MAKTAKTRIFPDTTLPLDDTKQLSTVSEKVLDKSDAQFQRKCPKTWFLSENGQILDKKSSKNGPDFFCQNKNFHWTFLDDKLSLIKNKIKKEKNINGLEENGQKQPKTI